MSTTNDAYVAEGLARLLEQFKGSLNLRELASVFLSQAQALEDAAFPLLGERSLDNATGDRLDRIGALVGETRGGRDDTDYRLALQAEIAVLNSRGTVEELLIIVDLLVQSPSADYEMYEYFPKGFYLRTVDYASGNYNEERAASTLKRAVSAGTTMAFVYAGSPDAFVFQLSSQAATSETSATLGLANDAKSSGGYLAQVI